MKKLLLLLLTIPVLFLSITGCESSSGGDDDSGADSTAILSGKVVNSETLEPIQSAVVRIMEYTEFYTYTDAYGSFELEFELKSAEQIHLITSPISYIPDTLSIYATPGVTIDELQLKPIPTGEIMLPSGNAASIILSSVSPTSIGVRESGSEEVATITFVVLDSTGIPIDDEHSVDLNFYLGGSPGGGLFFTPSTAQTGGDGKVTTYLFSGDSAGVVQIIAAVDQPGLPIKSKPVAVAIHGGFPHRDHFALANEKLNMPDDILGETNAIGAYLGDKYGNPVREGTAVYFTTSAAIIGGSAFTDNMGRAGVDFMTALPLPDGSYGPGVVLITAQTVDENEEIIEANTFVIMSGDPIISVLPVNIDVENDSYQIFNYRVADLGGNPMSGGQTIEVTLENGSVEITGDTKITLEDVVGSKYTEYQFRLTDAEPDTTYSNRVEVTIKSSGPNGDAKYPLTGYAH